jgi:hypothetical protein
MELANMIPEQNWTEANQTLVCFSCLDGRLLKLPKLAHTVLESIRAGDGNTYRRDSSDTRLLYCDICLENKATHVIPKQDLDIRLKLLGMHWLD